MEVRILPKPQLKLEMMDQIFSRSEMIDLLYSSMMIDDSMAEVVAEIKKDLLRMTDDEFIDLCKQSNLFLGTLRKNTYYLKTR